jgi:hypothetical protein
MDTLSLVLLYLMLCLVAGIAGRNRRIGFWGFLFSSICFTPIITLLFLYCAAPRKVDGPRRRLGSGQA